MTYSVFGEMLNFTQPIPILSCIVTDVNIFYSF